MPFASLLLALASSAGMFLADLGACTALLYEAIWKARVESRRTTLALRLGGQVMLLTALMTCAAHWGWNLGLLIWIGLLIAVTVAVLFLLPLLSRRWLGVTPHSMVLGLTVLARVLS